jgi:sigma-E factor negative regulatory protein RseB
VLGGAGEVAGRPAHVVVAQRPDGQVAARFWLDDTTGLLLRREVMDRSGRTSASLVLSLLSRPGAPVAYLPPLLPAVRSASLDRRSVASWAARGYPCPERVGGLTLFDVRTVPGTGSAVLHLTYSDGLSTVSVFVQRGRLDGDDVPGARRAEVSGQAVLVVAGHPRQLLWGAGGFVLTVVADSDRDVMAGVVADLPHTGAAPTGWARVERGVARVVSWVDPFD